MHTDAMLGISIGVGEMIWWALGAVLIVLIAKRLWAAYKNPYNLLGKQAAHMNWVASGFYTDKEGYKNIVLRRDEYEAFISYKKCKVFLVKPANYSPFDDFIAVERWLSEIEDDRPRKEDFGHHISELDIALETHKLYATENNIFSEDRGNGKDIYWNCCVSLYASILYAKEKSRIQIDSMTWNSIVRSIVVGMLDAHNPNLVMGTPAYKAVENQAFDDFKKAETAVTVALREPGPYKLEPVVKVLSKMFGANGNVEAEKALSALVLINAKKAHGRIIPEFMASFS
ncbi:MAG: hypothetical protein Q7U10_07610 [Thermodesulfovibrionia bacterium]|nr:hypothetical protein [Thermodesulfovibrionia bacterium]